MGGDLLDLNLVVTVVGRSVVHDLVMSVMGRLVVTLMTGPSVVLWSVVLRAGTPSVVLRLMVSVMGGLVVSLVARPSVVLRLVVSVVLNLVVSVMLRSMVSVVVLRGGVVDSLDNMRGGLGDNLAVGLVRMSVLVFTLSVLLVMDNLARLLLDRHGLVDNVVGDNWLLLSPAVMLLRLSTPSLMLRLSAPSVVLWLRAGTPSVVLLLRLAPSVVLLSLGSPAVVTVPVTLLPAAEGMVVVVDVAIPATVIVVADRHVEA